MAIVGTVVNGRVELDAPVNLPDGTRVRVDLEDEDDLDSPPPAETYEEHLAVLRQSFVDVDAGVPGMPLEQFAAELEKEFGPPPAPRVKP